MQLSAWITRAGFSRSEFARRIKVSPGHITGLCDGTTWPSRRIANLIFEETQGAVGPQDFMAGRAARNACAAELCPPRLQQAAECAEDKTIA